MLYILHVVTKRMICHKAILVITESAQCFHDIYSIIFNEGNCSSTYVIYLMECTLCKK